MDTDTSIRPSTSASVSNNNNNNSTTPPTQPLVTILGATGTGKSALAVSLARRFNGEIINADAMQMYTGLPIITNKIPVDEQHGIPHHLLGLLPLDSRAWTIKQFVREARKLVEDITSRGRLPIVVGGTGYYVHGLLIRDALLAKTGGKSLEDGEDGEEGEDGSEGGDGGEGGEGGNAIDSTVDSMTVEEMYAKLQELDPEMAKTWHPRDKRRIESSLKICLRTGRKASELYKEQQAAKEEAMKAANGSSDGPGGPGSLRYDTLLLWLEADEEVLRQRLDNRVDKMVADGLLKEVFSMYRTELEFSRKKIPIDKTKGIWQSIGYKELTQWAASTKIDQATFNPQHPIITNYRLIEQDPRLASQGIERVKIGTRQYAKRQNRYIRNRFSAQLQEARGLDRLFLLDSTDLSHWHETVVPQSEKLVSTFLEGRQLPDPASLSDLARTMLSKVTKHANWRNTRVAQFCEVCQKTMMSSTDMERHLNTKSHKKAAKAAAIAEIRQQIRAKRSQSIERNRTAAGASAGEAGPKVDDAQGQAKEAATANIEG